MTRPLRIVFDLDGVVATGTKEEVYSDEAGWAYDKCDVHEEIAEAIRLLHSEGVEIIFHTARHECDKDKTVSWLKANNIPYKALYLGKPFGDLYIDDKSFPVPFYPKVTSSLNVANEIFEDATKNRDKIGQNDDEGS